MNYDFYISYKKDKISLKKNKTSEQKLDFCLYVKLKAGFVKDKSKELEKYKNEIKKNEICSIEDFEKIKQVSGVIYEYEKDSGEKVKEELRSLIKNLPKYSFIIWVKFSFKAPYFSKDDDEFYVIQNPIVKDYAFKVPMIRSSSWKGSLANAFKKVINNENEGKKRKLIESYLRIFGAGSDSIKVIENYLKEKSKNLKEFKNKLLEFLIFELGLEVDFGTIKNIRETDNIDELFSILKNKISEKFKQIKRDQIYPLEFQTHKGRLITYPTFFDTLSLEVINPHDRKRRVGINPIYYEVVPANTNGILQLVYVPFDGILKKDNDLKNEVKEDLENLIKAIEELSEIGVGAKTKLGWGTFKLDEEKKYYCFAENIENIDKNGWRNVYTKS